AAALTEARQPAAAPTGRGAISGRVVDAYGDPAINVRVNVQIRTADNATRGIAGVETDDLGEYRIGRLAPGNYLVSVLQLQAFVMTPGPRPPPNRGIFPAARRTPPKPKRSGSKPQTNATTSPASCRQYRRRSLR